MKTDFFVLAISFVLAFSSCGGSQNNMSGSEGKEINITSAQLDVKVDPVCQMSMEKFPIADTMTYNGKLYGFCNSGCKKEFADDPEKFLSQLENTAE